MPSVGMRRGQSRIWEEDEDLGKASEKNHLYIPLRIFSSPESKIEFKFDNYMRREEGAH